MLGIVGAPGGARALPALWGGAHMLHATAITCCSAARQVAAAAAHAAQRTLGSQGGHGTGTVVQTGPACGVVPRTGSAAQHVANAPPPIAPQLLDDVMLCARQKQV
jgi:hypothetical protein